MTPSADGGCDFPARPGLPATAQSVLWSPLVDPAIVLATERPDLLPSAAPPPHIAANTKRDSPEGRYALDPTTQLQILLLGGATPNDPHWFYQAVLDDALILTIDRAYFDLTGGLERWLYRIVRKHGGRQRRGWRFDFRHLHQKSGSLSPFKRFAFELRDIIRRQPLPGYTLFAEVEIGGRMLLAFEPRACGQAVNPLVPFGTQSGVLSGTDLPCHCEPKPGLRHGDETRNCTLNLESNQESNFEERAREVGNLIRGAARHLTSAAKARPTAATVRQVSRASDPADAPLLPLDDQAGKP